MKTKLRTGTFIKHSDQVFEYIPDPNINFVREDAEEINELEGKLSTGEYNLLVDLRNGISFDMNAASIAGNNPNQRKLAFLVTQDAPKIMIESLINIQQVSYPIKSLEVFTDEKKARSWVGLGPQQTA